MRTLVAAAGFLLIIGFFLSTEHRAHAFGVLPYLFLLACPFLHLFGHGGHGGHGRHGGSDDRHREPADDPEPGHHAHHAEGER